ncbi:MAG: hypothetical protein JOY64_02470 [Alphaproteobacteria bacterium]|nr:hypothetical protein [Alphaproteobacteria bacterium]MBV8406467.1 hypothetical protein [Alphaproteobacteria bacterium]
MILLLLLLANNRGSAGNRQSGGNRGSAGNRTRDPMAALFAGAVATALVLL